MIRSQLTSYSGNDPVWGFVALVGAERFTGEAAVGLDPRVHLYALDGHVYYAEREGDAPIGARLVNCGAVTPEQLTAGTVQLGGTSSLARLFQRQPEIDRDIVELTIEHATEALLEQVANRPVGMPEVFPLRHHPAGIHHWQRSSPAGAGAPLELPTDEPVAEPSAPTGAAIPPPPPPPPSSAAIVVPPLLDSPPVAVIEPPALLPPALTEPEPEPLAVAAEPEARPAPEVVPAFEPLALSPLAQPREPEPEPQQEPAQEISPITRQLDVITSEVPVVRFEPLPMIDLSAQLRPNVPDPEPEPPVVDVQPDVVAHDEPQPEPEPATTAEAEVEVEVEAEVEVEVEVEVEPDPARPGLQPLGTAAHIPSFADLDAALSESRTDAPAAAATSVDAASLPALDDLAPLSSLAFLSSIGDAGLEPLPELADLPSLAGRAGVPAAVEPAPTTPPLTPVAGLPKLASAPISVNDLPDPATYDASAAPGASTHTLAAVEIWELVDDLTVAQQSAAPSPADGADERQRRGWLRGRKG